MNYLDGLSFSSPAIWSVSFQFLYLTGPAFSVHPSLAVPTYDVRVARCWWQWRTLLLCRKFTPSRDVLLSRYSSTEQQFAVVYGSTLACGARGIRIEPRCGQKFMCVFTKITEICSFGQGLHTYCSAQIDSAFHSPRDGQWVSTFWLSNKTWRWVKVRPIVAYIQADSKVKFVAWPACWRPPGADRLWPKVNSRIAYGWSRGL